MNKITKAPISIGILFTASFCPFKDECSRKCASEVLVTVCVIVAGKTVGMPGPLNC